MAYGAIQLDMQTEIKEEFLSIMKSVSGKQLTQSLVHDLQNKLTVLFRSHNIEVKFRLAQMNESIFFIPTGLQDELIVNGILNSKTEHAPTEPNCSNVATILMIGTRYFAHRNNKNVVTAWSLAGATLFNREDLIQKAEAMLKRLGYKPIRKEVICKV